MDINTNNWVMMTCTDQLLNCVHAFINLDIKVDVRIRDAYGDYGELCRHGYKSTQIKKIEKITYKQSFWATIRSPYILRGQRNT